MWHLCSTQEIIIDEEEPLKVAERRSCKEFPEEQECGGELYRKTAPGSWQENLTPEQAKTVGWKAVSLLKAFYPEHTL